MSSRYCWETRETIHDVDKTKFQHLQILRSNLEPNKYFRGFLQRQWGESTGKSSNRLGSSNNSSDFSEKNNNRLTSTFWGSKLVQKLNNFFFRLFSNPYSQISTRSRQMSPPQVILGLSQRCLQIVAKTFFQKTAPSVAMFQCQSQKKRGDQKLTEVP
jgi:hypothetical protein